MAIFVESKVSPRKFFFQCSIFNFGSDENVSPSNGIIQSNRHQFSRAKSHQRSIEYTRTHKPKIVRTKSNNQTIILSNPASIVCISWLKSPGANVILTYWEGIFHSKTHEQNSELTRVRKFYRSSLTRWQHLLHSRQIYCKCERVLACSISYTVNEKRFVCHFRQKKEVNERQTHTHTPRGYEHHLIMARIAREIN